MDKIDGHTPCAQCGKIRPVLITMVNGRATAFCGMECKEKYLEEHKGAITNAEQGLLSGVSIFIARKISVGISVERRDLKDEK